MVGAKQLAPASAAMSRDRFYFLQQEREFIPAVVAGAMAVSALAGACVGAGSAAARGSDKKTIAAGALCGAAGGVLTVACTPATATAAAFGATLSASVARAAAVECCAAAVTCGGIGGGVASATKNVCSSDEQKLIEK